MTNTNKRWTCLVAGALCLLVTAAQDADDQPLLEDTKNAFEQWVETRRLISAEKRDWQLGRELLRDRVDLVADRIASERASIGAAEASISDAEAKRRELQEQSDTLAAATSSLEAVVAELEAEIKRLLPRLPEPVRERVLLFSQRLPEDPENTQTSLSKRYQNLVGILTALDKAQADISVTSEVRELSEGVSAEVSTLYVGLGQGYYVTADRSAAGVGTAAEDGWEWTPANESADAIALAIAIFQNEEAAAFVRLPVRIR